MPRSELQNHLRKQLRRIRYMLDDAKNLSRGRKKLHRLRQALKRWRAHLRFWEVVDPCFPYPEVYALFKPVFSGAGSLRFWQMQQQILDDNSPQSESFVQFYGAWIKKQQQHAQKDFLRAVKKSDIPRWRDLKQEFQTSERLCVPDRIGKYFQIRKKDIQITLTRLHRASGSELHMLRKNLKEYGINRRLVSRCWKMDPGAPPGPPLNNQLADNLLGRWHDLDAATVQLAADLQHPDWPEALQSEGAAVCNAWKQKERVLRQQVERAFQQKIA